MTPGTFNVLTTPAISFLANSLLTGQGAVDQAATSKVLNVTSPALHLKNPYSMQFAASIEKEWSNTLGSISYVGTLGRKLLRVTTPNGGLNDSSLTNRAGLPFVSVLGVSQIPFFRGSIEKPTDPANIYAGAFSLAPTVYEDSAKSSYNSLQLELRRRYAHGLQFGASFTWSHSIDDSSDFFDSAGSFALPQNSRARAEFGSSSFDSRFRTATHFMVDFKDVPQLHRLPFLNNWRLSGVLALQTGQPFTVNTIYDVNRDGNATDRLATDAGLQRRPAAGDRRTVLVATVPLAQLLPGGSCLSAPGCDGAVGRNTFRGAGNGSLNLLLNRTFRFGDHMVASLRAEGYNVTNHANFAPSVRILEFPSFGQSVATQQPGRVLQLGIRLDIGRGVGRSSIPR